jgi:multicomponent K+:H+ antiporter subunit A
MSQPLLWLAIAVFAPLLTGVATLLMPRAAMQRRVWLAFSGPALSLAAVIVHLVKCGISSRTDPVTTWALPWIPSLNLNIAFFADGLGAFFALLVAGVGALIVLYARGYFGADRDELYRFYPTLGFFTTAMLGIVLADHTLLTLLFWEATSISSFLLIGWDRYDKESVRLAMQAFFTTGLGGMALLGGVLLLGVDTGLWRWSAMLAAEPGSLFDFTLAWDNLTLWAFVLLFFGAATKSAQFPWHYWLPGAMAAPTPVSAFLHSATMVKAGVFLAGRLFPLFSALLIWPWVLTGFGAVTMLLGAALALNQHDLKRMFAYTTVSQLGLLMAMYGLGGFDFHSHGHTIANIDWSVTQIANHAFYKAPLFLIAGALGHVAGTRMLPELFGAFRQHKVMTLVLLLAGYALAAGPGTISFQAKELFLYATVHGAEGHPWVWAVVVMTVLTAMFNVAIFIRLLTTLLGWPRGQRQMGAAEKEIEHDPDALGSVQHHHAHHEPGFWGAMLWVPAALIVSLQYVGGVAPALWNRAFAPLEVHQNYEAFADGLPTFWYAFSHPSLPLYLSMLAIVLGVLLALSPWMRREVRDVCDNIYPAMYHACVVGGGKAFRVIQTGNLRHYMLFVLGAFLIAFAGTVYVDSGMFSKAGAPLSRWLEFWPGLAMGVIICYTAFALTLTHVRVFRVLLLGACGLSVVGMYIIYQAPDLALTQLMFEIISVLLFVLVLRLLPRHQMHSPPGRRWRGPVAVAVGIAFGWITLIAASQPPAGGKVGQFFAAYSDHVPTEQTTAVMADPRSGGGENVVNVILVDFRGFDTLGEVTVLALAALGVWSLMPGRRQRRAQ